MKIQNKKILIKKIINWGKNNTDDFPWRNPYTPYESAVAEIMLIRTPAKQVLPVYKEFINNYSSIYSLYNSSKKDIKYYIDKLGLSWRINLLKEMSNYICEKLNGKYPKTLTKLKDVPGIGDYTAAAILTFYYKKRAILIDSNTIRFLQRYQNKKFKGEARRNKKVIKLMNNLTPSSDENAVKFNISLLDFMRKICTPHNPQCKKCVINNYCNFDH